MRVNDYEKLDDFIYEYEKGKCFSWQDENHRERFMGIEFKYNKKYYRMCREPGDETILPKLPNGRVGHYEVTIMHCEKFGYPAAERFESLGWYSDIYDLLENCYLDGIQFKTVIMQDDTEILGKD